MEGVEEVGREYIFFNHTTEINPDSVGTGREIGLIPRDLHRKGGSNACPGVHTFDYMDMIA